MSLIEKEPFSEDPDDGRQASFVESDPPEVEANLDEPSPTASQPILMAIPDVKNMSQVRISSRLPKMIIDGHEVTQPGLYIPTFSIPDIASGPANAHGKVKPAEIRGLILDEPSKVTKRRVPHEEFRTSSTQLKVAAYGKPALIDNISTMSGEEEVPDAFHFRLLPRQGYSSDKLVPDSAVSHQHKTFEGLAHAGDAPPIHKPDSELIRPPSISPPSARLGIKTSVSFSSPTPGGMYSSQQSASSGIQLDALNFSSNTGLGANAPDHRALSNDLTPQRPELLERQATDNARVISPTPLVVNRPNNDHITGGTLLTGHTPKAHQISGPPMDLAEPDMFATPLTDPEVSASEKSPAFDKMAATSQVVLPLPPAPGGRPYTPSIASDVTMLAPDRGLGQGKSLINISPSSIHITDVHSTAQTAGEPVVAEAFTLFQPTPRPDTPAISTTAPMWARSVERQTLDAIIHTSSNSTNVQLSPEELGQVRITFHRDADGLRVAIWAQRDDVSEHLRRHSDQLIEDLRSQGFDNPRMTFGQNSGKSRDRGTSDREHSPTLPNGPEVRMDDEGIERTRLSTSRGLDIRI